MQVPISCFSYVYEGSGASVYSNGATMGHNGSNVKVRTYHRTDDEIIVGPSGQTPAYYQFLDTRFDTPASGWNA